MKHIQQIEAVQAGLSGPLAEFTREVIASGNSPISRLEAIATYKETDSIGKLLGETEFATDSDLDIVPIISMEDALDNTISKVVLSNLGHAGASLYEADLARGRVLTTTGIPNRLTPDSLLTNAYINSGLLSGYFAEHPTKRILATGGGMSSIIAIAMAPIDRQFGVKSMRIETMQGRDGEDTRGRPVEISDKVDDDAEQIRSELRRFLGKPAIDSELSITSVPKLANWDVGHHAKIDFQLEDPASAGEIRSLLKKNKAPKWLKHSLSYGAYKPRRHPVKVMPSNESESLVTWEDYPKQGLRYGIQPMKIRARLEKLPGGKMQGSEIEVAGDNFMVVPIMMMNIGQGLREGLIK